MKNLPPGLSAEYAGKFPPKVEGIHHGDIHPLTSLGRVGMTRVAGNEDVVVVCGEGIAHALADLIACPPVDIGEFDVVRFQDTCRLGQEFVERDFGAVHALTRCQSTKLGVYSHHALFARHHENRPVGL